MYSAPMRMTYARPCKWRSVQNSHAFASRCRRLPFHASEKRPDNRRRLEHDQELGSERHDELRNDGGEANAGERTHAGDDQRLHDHRPIENPIPGTNCLQHAILPLAFHGRTVDYHTDNERTNQKRDHDH